MAMMMRTHRGREGGGKSMRTSCFSSLSLGSCYGGGNLCGRSGCGGPPGFEAGVDNVSFGVAVAQVAGGERQGRRSVGATPGCPGTGSMTLLGRAARFRGCRQCRVVAVLVRT